MRPVATMTAAAAPLLLRGGTVLTLDREATVLPGSDLLAIDGRIAAIGPRLEAPADARVLEVTDHWLIPGLIQGHLHLGQSLFRGLAEERRLLAWLRERIWPLEAALDDEAAHVAGALGAAECLLGGTTTIQDIGLGPGIDGLLAAIAESGLRGFVGLCLMDGGEGLPAALATPAPETLARAERLGRQWDGAAGGRLRWALNPRFILSASDELWEGIVGLSRRTGWPIHTHALEQREETAAVRRAKGGRDEIEFFRDRGLLELDLRLAHGVWIEAQHRPLLAERRTAVVHCPGSNLKLGSGVARIARLAAAGVPLGIGADGAACNNGLDALAEVRLAAGLQSALEGPGSFPALAALRLATSEGARALRLEADIGALEVGKRADVVVLRLDRPHLAASPGADPHDLLVWGGAGAAVRHVAIDGRLEVEDGRLTRIDLPELLARARSMAMRVARRAGLL